MINAVLQASAATAYLTSDLLNPDRKAIDGIRIAGSASWLANSICCFWKGANEHKENVDDKKTNTCTASNPAYDCINEVINTTGAFLYLTHTCLLWSRGKPRPLKLAANACWVVGAIHDVIEASRLQHDETKPDSLPANKTEICTLARLEVSVAQNIA